MCLRCHSRNLRIRRKQGIERLLVLLTQKRKFFCVDCFYIFRAPDRRRISRDRAYMAGHASESLSR